MLGMGSPARYREPITVQRVKGSPTVDLLGGVDREAAANWETYHAPYASYAARGGQEFERFGIHNSEVSHLFVVRKGSETVGITADDRILVNARRFEIRAVYVPDAASREVYIEATEIK